MLNVSHFELICQVFCKERARPSVGAGVDADEGLGRLRRPHFHPLG